MRDVFWIAGRRCRENCSPRPGSAAIGCHRPISISAGPLRLPRASSHVSRRKAHQGQFVLEFQKVMGESGEPRRPLVLPAKSGEWLRRTGASVLLVSQSESRPLIAGVKVEVFVRNSGGKIAWRCGGDCRAATRPKPAARRRIAAHSASR